MDHRNDDHKNENYNIRSPYPHDDDDDDEDEGLNSHNDDTADSLDIKPPQAHRRENFTHYKDGKKSSRIKKHSREHKHKLKDQEKSRHRSGKNERTHSHHRDIDQVRHPERVSGDMRETVRYSQTGHRNEYYRVKEHREKEHRTKVFDRPRKTEMSENMEAERVLEDLRSRLLSKRNKQNAERRPDGQYEYRMDRQAYVQEQQYERKDKEPVRKDQYREYKDRRNVIEVIDSPENYGETEDRFKEEKPIVDPELIARRAKLLEAEREMARRKELAREELEARREMRREREEVITESPPEKRKRHEKTLQTKNKTQQVQDDYQTDESMNSDDETVSHSGSNTITDSDQDASDVDVPTSPLSVGDLSKSERRNRSQSRSRTRSHSKSPSPSLSSERSDSTRSKSRSPSRTPSRSPRLRKRSRSQSSDSEFEHGKNQDYQLDSKEAKLKKDDDQEVENQIKTDEEKLPNYYPGIQGCRSVEEFQCLNRIEEGTYGVVYRAKDKRTEEIVALKRLKMEKEKEGFPITSLREINTLLKGQHPNIVTVREIVVGSNMDKIFIVMDYVEHDMKSLMETMKHRKQAFLPAEVKCLLQQLLTAVGHLHDNWILHRDLKTSNLLLSHKGILKVGDFGLAREYGSPLKAYTSIVVTLWYRAPELLLCCKEYSVPIDMWSVGCIFAEFLSMTALFPGKSEVDQLNRIFKDLGTPNEKIWPGYNQLPAVQKMTFTEYPVSNLRKKFSHLTSELGLSLLQGLLTYDPKQRLSADQALQSNYFKELPLPIDPAMFPTWPAKSELGARKALASSPKPPSGGGQFKKLGENEDNPGFIFNMESRQLAMGPGFSLKF